MRKSLLSWIILAATACTTLAAPVINEIMFHTPDKPVPMGEDVREEWVEIFNGGVAAVDLSGWKFSKGVTFTFPAGTSIAAGGYVVVAADVAIFQSGYPGFSGTLVGGWTGTLSNSSDHLQLDDATGKKVSEVTYSKDGNWALRARAAATFSHQGWEWVLEADGGGKTLELRNPLLGTGSGQNWGVSAVAGGSPGAANSVASADLPPLIHSASHAPLMPKSTEPVVVSCALEDEVPGASATLFWRVSAASPGAFNPLPMSDTDGDGRVEATIPSQANLAIVEWYISATDGAQARTWPAPARTSNPGVVPETFGQVTNALFQVDNSYAAAATFLTAAENPIYRVVLTVPERSELVQLQTTSGQEQSGARFNGTFISHDGTGLQVRYLIDVGNRGQSSALGPPNNFHIGFRADDSWNGRGTVGLNCRFGYGQVLGAAMFELAGIPPQDAAAVKFRLNGADLSEPGVASGTTGRMYGRYARIEGRGSAWAKHHFPNDGAGNFYRLDYHYIGQVGVPPGNLGSGEFRYEGEEPLAYADTFIKESNYEQFDFSDLIELCRVISAPKTGGSGAQPAITDVDYVAALSSHLDLDETYKFFAVDALIGNMEGGLQNGGGDDASMYRGTVDTRFKFIPHDLDTIFDIGDTTGGVSRSIFSYDGGTSPGTGVLGLARIFNHPQLVPRYYSALLEAMDTWFNNATIDPIIDRIMAGWVPQTDAVSQNRSIADIKNFVMARRANVLAQIQQIYSLNVTTSATSADGYKQTNDGSATFSGTFNVAKTYSITVNGQLANLSYRTTTSPVATAGTWSLAVPAAGGLVLKPGLNKVVVKFWDAPGGAGKVLTALNADVYYNTGSSVGVAGSLTAGSLRLTAPASFIPGVPFLARVDLLDGQGNLDRSVWDANIALSSNVSGMTLPPVQLYNGTGAALVTVGGSSSQPDQTIIARGATWLYLDDGSNQGTAWRAQTFAAESAAPWKFGPAELGVGDGDEATVVARNTTTSQPFRTYYFRRHFTLPTPLPAYAAVKIHMKCDDGAIVYVNGTQAAITGGMTANMAYNALCTFNRSTTSTPNENTIEEYSIPLNLLVAGDNTIAVEVHNTADTSPDISFDTDLIASYPSADPGNFTLTATGAGFSAQKALTSIGASPAMTDVSGALATGTTTWSGIIHVTGDVTVPVGGILNISAGTHVLMDGDATAGSTAGKRIVVNGALNSQGTASNPVTFTATNATDRWGGLVFTNAQPSTLSYTLLNHAGHTTGVGHTGRGPMLRIAGSAVTLSDSVLADGPAKAAYTSGTCSLTIQRSLITRMITGPEVEDGCTVLVEDSNIQQILPDFRESNSLLSDDEDCFYIHNGSARTILFDRCVFARCGDDVIDCLGGPFTVRDSILREGWDKGISLLNNDLNISGTQIIRCDKGIALKSQNANTLTVNATNLTIVSENHDSLLAPWGYTGGVNGGDPDTASTGFYTQNKAGQSNAGATLVFNVKNCIVQAQVPVLVDSPYSSANTTITYSDLRLEDGSAFSWPGTGNITADPLFANVANGNYRITAASPARDTGDPATFDPDNTRVDMGALPFTGTTTGGTITWSAAGGPYRVTANATIPAGTTLVIQPGAHVYLDQNVRMTVNGRIVAQGTADQHIVFSHVPGTIAAGDADPIKNGVQTGPPKWGGLRIIDSMSQENMIAYCDFVNAQGTSPLGVENQGGLGVIRSWAWVDHCSWTGSHLRWCYGRNVKLTVTNCSFQDMFDATEAPPADFITGADNSQEPLKVEYPSTDPEVANAAFNGGFPIGGWFRVYFNDFYGNKGHNDVFDGDGGRAGVTFPLDCRYNYFHGLTGDEHLDLAGDALIANNIIERGTKDQYTSDTGYSNAISTGTSGVATTNMVARNLFFDIDHVINCKAQVAAIIEHNTIASIHPDFHYVAGAPYFIDQNVNCSVANMLVRNDGATPGHGDGAYFGYNIISGVPRLVGDADLVQTATNTFNNSFTTKIEFNQNLLDAVTDTSIGANHPGTIYSSAFGVNWQGAPLFVDAAEKNYNLQPGSPARGAGPAELDLGFTTPEWAYIDGGPVPVTNSNTATFQIGGPGLIAYKWRLDGGVWSAVLPVGSGATFPRTGPTLRQSTLSLTGLGTGSHTLEVLGQDFAGNWQDADPAKAYLGLPQFTPTARTWTVDPAAQLVRINEVRADSATLLPDAIELFNGSAAAVDLGGYTLTDDATKPLKYAFPAGTMIAAGGYLTVTTSQTAISLDRDGDDVRLYRSGALVDSVTFGPQIPDLTIGRVGRNGSWALCSPTFDSANAPVAVGGSSGVRISEWFTSGVVLYSNDWIELANPSSLPVSISGVHLSNNGIGDPNAHTFPPLSFIGANGFLKLIADGKPANGPGHLAFTLDAQQESVALADAAGTLLDVVFFGPQTTDRSQGRDATGAYQFYELPTRGLANGTSDPAYANALAILRGLRITEIMFNPIGGAEYEFLELRNVGATALDLTGVKIANGVDFTFTGGTLAPGQNIVVVSNLAKFRSRYGTTVNVAGAYAGKLDNAGETIAVQLPPPFDANAMNFAYNNTWQAGADGAGRSLVVGNLLLPAIQWGDRATWLASASNGGDPDGAIIPPFGTFADWTAHFASGIATADIDRDGIPALIEFALGLDPSTPATIGIPTVTVAADGHLELHIAIPASTLATQLHGLPEITYTVEATGDFAAWTTIATKTHTTPWTGTATVTIDPAVGGVVPVTVRDPALSTSRYLRLRAGWTP